MEEMGERKWLGRREQEFSRERGRERTERVPEVEGERPRGEREDKRVW